MQRRIMGIRILLVVSLVGFFICGCDKLSELIKPKISAKKEAPVAQGKVVAKVNDMVITLDELERYVDNYNKQIDAFREMYPGQDIGVEKVDTAQKKIDLLKSDLVRQKLLYQEAQDMGLGRKEDIKTAVDDFKTGLLVASLIKEETDKVKVTSQDVEDYYNKNKEFMRDPEERRVREIVAKSQAQANAALVEVLQGVDFAEAAKKYSTAETASRGGDLGFIGPGAKGADFPQFDIAVYSLDTGGVSSVIKNPKTNEFYIVKVEEKKGGKEKPLSDLWDDIKAQLEQVKQKAAIDDLVGKLQREAKIEYRTDEIK